MGKTMESKKTDLIFIICFLVVCLVPLLFMPVFGNQAPVGNEPEPKEPSLKTTDGKVNTNIMQDAGDYFSKKFAFRQELINTGDLIKGKVFGVSAQSGVIMGKDGWMFYSNTLEDFQGVSTLTDYRIASSAYNLKLIQDKLEKEKIKFAFTISPNKNSLYPDRMRSGYKINKQGRNSARLIKELKAKDVNYIDLYHLFEDKFKDKKEILYHKTDSHWNNKGAAMVSGYLQQQLGHEHTDWSGEKYKTRYDFQGDLATMVYPLVSDKDKEIYYDRKFTFDYSKKTLGEHKKKENREKKITDINEIETTNGSKKGNLVMLRDSFGISLVPFMAEDYAKGYYINKTPYFFQPAIDRKADTAIFELVERNLSYLTTDSPEIDMGKVDIKTDQLKIDKGFKGSANAEMSTSGNDFTKVYGNLDPSKMKDDTKMYISITSTDGKEYVTPAFRTTRYGQKSEKNKDYGYSAYIGWESLEPGDYSVELIYQNGSNEPVRTGDLGIVTM